MPAVPQGSESRRRPAAQPAPGDAPPENRARTDSPVRDQAPEPRASGIQVSDISSSGQPASSGGNSSSIGDASMSSMPEPQAGGSIPGGTGSSQLPVSITTEQQPNVSFKYCKTFQLYSAGYQFVNQSNSGFYKPPNLDWSSLISDSYTGVYSTPLAVLNPGMAQLYMTNAEFDQLPLGSYATHCEIKVTPLGYRLPFTTNEATSTFANSQTLVQVATATGLNTIMNGFVGSYTTDPADLTRPTGSSANSDVPEVTLYGLDGGIGANMGVPRHWNHYWTMLTPAPPGLSPSTVASPNLLNHMKVENVNDVKGTPLVNYSYKFRNGILKFPSTTQFNYFNDATNLPEGNYMPGWKTRIIQSTGITTPRRQELYGDATQKDTSGLAAAIQTSIKTDIEKADTCTRQYNDPTHPDRPPLVFFGVLPVQSNPALAPTATFADIVVQWQVQTCLYITYQANYVHPLLDIYYIKSWDPNLGSINYTGAQFQSNTYALISNRKWWSNSAHMYAQGPQLILTSSGVPTGTLDPVTEEEGDYEMVAPPTKSKRALRSMFE